MFSGANEATANNYRRVGSDTTAQDQFDARVDHYIGARHRLMGRYAYLRDDSAPATPLPDGSGTLLTLTHERLFDESSRDGHEKGWIGSLDKLEKFVA